jgi:hypothetical protein
VFAAGDMARGQALVLWAIAEGRDAAIGIDRFPKVRQVAGRSGEDRPERSRSPPSRHLADAIR